VELNRKQDKMIYYLIHTVSKVLPQPHDLNVIHANTRLVVIENVNP